MALQPLPNPSKEDYFRSLEIGYGKPFYQEKSSFGNVLPSYWPYSQNHLQPPYNSNPTLSMPESMMMPLPNNPYNGN